jgi:hypothetical protein
MVISSFFGALTHALFLLWPCNMNISMNFVGGENRVAGFSHGPCFGSFGYVTLTAYDLTKMLAWLGFLIQSSVWYVS